MTATPGDTGANPQRRIRHGLLWAFVVAVCAAWLLWPRLPEAFSPRRLWDFQTYYYAVKVHEAGGNPWNPAELSEAAGRDVHPFLYPHHTLAFFRLFVIGDLSTSKNVYLLAKLPCVVALLVLWTSYFVRAGARRWFLVFAALGYQATIFRDLVAGNVSLFEQTLIWFGLFALMRGRMWLFCVLIILAAQFKILPLCLLGLVLLTESPRKWAYLAASLVACVLLVVGVYLSDPQAAQTFLHLTAAVAPVERGGAYNQCALPLIREITAEMMKHFPVFDDVSPRAAAYLPYTIYVLVALFGFICSVRGGRDLKRAIFLGLLTYALITPRLKDYSYILLLVPTFELIRPRIGRPGFDRVVVFPLAALLAMPAPHVLWLYRSLVLAVWVWAVSLRVDLSETEGKGVAMETVPSAR